MKAIHLTAYGNPAQNLRMVEVSEPNAPSAGEGMVPHYTLSSEDL
jgi:hypothetical protein